MPNIDPRLQDSKGNTALHEAGIRGDTQILNFLFNADLSLNDLNRQNFEGETPLFMAAANGHYAAADVMLDKGDLINRGAREPYCCLGRVFNSKLGHGCVSCVQPCLKLKTWPRFRPVI